MKLLRHFWQDIEAWLCILIFIGITALGFINVCVRYLTSYAFASTEELLLQGFLLLTIFGAALAARRGEHLAVTFFSDFLPLKWLQIVRVFAALVSVILLLAAAWYCGKMALEQKNSGIVSSSLQVPLWYYSAILPFGFLLIAIRVLEHTKNILRHPTMPKIGEPS